MNRIALACLAAALLLLAACADPLPKDKLSYAGEWRAPQVYLLITPDGRCEYERRRGAKSELCSHDESIPDVHGHGVGHAAARAARGHAGSTPGRR